jgi:hypothetical protein
MIRPLRVAIVIGIIGLSIWVFGGPIAAIFWILETANGLPYVNTEPMQSALTWLLNTEVITILNSPLERLRQLLRSVDTV